MPKQSEIEIPLLKCLEEMKGQGKPLEIYVRVAKLFPQLTDADLAETLPSGGNKWKNRIQWVRQKLIAKGDVESPERGVWAITKKGRTRLASETGSSVREVTAPLSANLEELADEYFTAFSQKVQQELQDLEPKQFERFAGALLSAYGFTDIKVTGKTGDGGIDGNGLLKVGLSTIRAAFQCKRWQGLVGRSEIDKFRGTIQGEFEQGIFFTTSDFSDSAREVSIKKGAVPIVLLNGEEIVKLMVDRELGVRRRPLELYEDQLESLFEKEE